MALIYDFAAIIDQYNNGYAKESLFLRVLVCIGFAIFFSLEDRKND